MSKRIFNHRKKRKGSKFAIAKSNRSIKAHTLKDCLPYLIDDIFSILEKKNIGTILS